MEQLDEHKRSKKHKKNEKDFKAQNPQLSNSSIFQNITQEKPSLTAEVSKEENSSKLQVMEDSEDSK